MSPFLAELLVEGPLVDGVSWIASARRSLVEETSGTLLGGRQPLSFESQLLKVTATTGDELRCSALGLRTSDRGRLDPEETESEVAWENLLAGGRCVAQLEGFLRLVEANFSYTKADNNAVSRGSSDLHSSIRRMQHDAHTTSLVGSIPLYAGYYLYTELTDFDLEELFGLQVGEDGISGISGYLETSVPLGDRIGMAREHDGNRRGGSLRRAGASTAHVITRLKVY